jgi:DnaJ-class molecular chaperone
MPTASSAAPTSVRIRRGAFGGRGGAGGPGEEFGFSDIFSDLSAPVGVAKARAASARAGRDVRYTLEVDFSKRLPAPRSG